MKPIPPPIKHDFLVTAHSPLTHAGEGREAFKKGLNLYCAHYNNKTTGTCACYALSNKPDQPAGGTYLYEKKVKIAQGQAAGRKREDEMSIVSTKSQRS